MQSPEVTARQSAIQEVRARYERGDLSLDELRKALDDLVEARDANECRAIIAALPTGTAAHRAMLAALEPAPPALPEPRAPREQSGWLVTFMSETKKLKRRWRLRPFTRMLTLMGDTKVDLSLADLSAQTTLRVTAVMGSVKIYVPQSADVEVRVVSLLSDVKALGESATGVIAFGHEEHQAEGIGTAPRIQIEVLSLMGNVHVVLTSERMYSVSELVRDALRAATEGMRRGLAEGMRTPAALDAPRRD